MTNPKSRWPEILGAAALCGMIMLTGCGAEPEPAPVVRASPPPPPPPPPAAPKAKTIQALMDELGIDRRVNLDEASAPRSTEDRIAVLEFLDGFVRGDAKAVEPMLAATDRYQLGKLVASGEWAAATHDVTFVKAQAGTVSAPAFGGSANVLLAIFAVGTAFQPQLWAYTADGDAYTFEALPVVPGMMDRLEGDDQIASWMAILAGEYELATTQDEEFVIPNQDLGNNEGDDSGGDAGGGDPSQPGNGPGWRPGKGRRKQGSPD